MQGFEGHYDDDRMKRDSIIASFLAAISILSWWLFGCQQATGIRVPLWLPIFLSSPYLLYSILVPVFIRYCQSDGHQYWYWHMPTVLARSFIVIFDDVLWVAYFWPGTLLVHVVDYIHGRSYLAESPYFGRNWLRRKVLLVLAALRLLRIDQKYGWVSVAKFRCRRCGESMMMRSDLPAAYACGRCRIIIEGLGNPGAMEWRFERVE